MTSGEITMELQNKKRYEIASRILGDPELGPVRADPNPQKYYVESVSKCPVRDFEGFFTIQGRGDLDYVAVHPAVVQGSKFIGSDRPAIPLGLDGPIHRQYRKLLNPVFTAKRVAPLYDQIRATANAAIDKFIDSGEADIVKAWAEPLPTALFLSIMGLPAEDQEDFLSFKRLILNNNEIREGVSEEDLAQQRAHGVRWIQDYFDAELDRRGREPERDDLIGWLLTAEVDGTRLDRQELQDILGLLMVAGLDTVTASLSCILSHLARNPEARERIVADPELLPSAIEELMRFESPVSDGFRMTTEDLTLPSGKHIPANSWMHISWAAANLDPAAFPDPLTVDLARSPNPHVGFASGLHRCLGSHLARLELRAALEAWHERIPSYSLKSGEDLTYAFSARAPIALWLTWDLQG